MKTSLRRIIVSALVFFFGSVLLVSAQSATQQVTGAFGSIKTILKSFSDDVLAAVGTLFMGIAVVTFFLGIVQYIWGLRQGDGNKVKEGNKFMMWGLVALFVMFSVYGIVKFAQDIFFKGQDITTIKIPQVKFDQSVSAPASPSQGNPATGGYRCPDGITTYDDPANSGACPKK